MAAIPSELLLTMMLLVGLGHLGCADSLVGIPCDRWAAVPSLKNIGSAHPFRIIVSKLLKPQFVEISVTASELARGAADVERRHLNPGYYNILTPIPKGKHIMVIDDTWVSGGHAQSVAMALKRAGAAKVSILAIGRWLRMNDRRTKGVYNRLIRNRPYNADICPWTGGIVRVDRLSRPRGVSNFCPRSECRFIVDCRPIDVAKEVERQIDGTRDRRVLCPSPTNPQYASVEIL
jgi:hypothetical protein